MSTPATDSVFDDFDDAQDYVIVARVGDRVRIVSSGRLEAVFVDRSGGLGDTVPEDAAEVGVTAAGFAGVIVRPRGRKAAAPPAAPAPADAIPEVPAVAEAAPAPSFSAFVPPSIDDVPSGPSPAAPEEFAAEVGAPSEDEPIEQVADQGAGQAGDQDKDKDKDKDQDQDQDQVEVEDRDQDEVEDEFDESTGSGFDPHTHERIPSFANAPVAEPQLPAERLQLLEDIPDFDAIMSGEHALDPREAEPEDDGVSALQGLFDPSAGQPASGPVAAQADASSADEDDEDDEPFGPGETESYDRAWSPGVMPVASMTDYPPLERAEPGPVSEDESRIEETIRRGDPLLRSTLEPDEHTAVAVLALSTGERLPITGTILIGRSPSVLYAYGDEPRLVTLDVGLTDISRNHLEVRLDGDQVLMRDMGSTNGTLLTRAGTPTVRLPSEAPIVGFPGDVFELGGALTVTIVGV